MLIENNPPQSGLLEAEHGISFWVEYERSCLIFDTGKSGAFVANARKLGLDLCSPSRIVTPHRQFC